ncbi:MAG: cation transporter, partial [Methanoregulaceae archaeon]|nr:cation transporter [Methanoregulaceae archaeon]
MGGIGEVLSERKEAVRTTEKYRERAVLFSLIGAIAPAIPKLVASVLSGSVTLYSSTAKTVNEAVATFVAYIIARRIARGDQGIYDYGMGKLENIARVITGGLMLISLVILVIATVYRLLVPASLGTGGVVLGVVVLVVVIGTNVFFWVRNYRIACLDPSPLMDSQWRLFRMKAFANLVVLFALLLSLFCAGLPWAVYIDPLGSFVVIGFLLQSGYRMISA